MSGCGREVQASWLEGDYAGVRWHEGVCIDYIRWLGIVKRDLFPHGNMLNFNII